MNRNAHHEDDFSKTLLLLLNFNEIKLAVWYINQCAYEVSWNFKDDHLMATPESTLYPILRIHIFLSTGLILVNEGSNAPCAAASCVSLTIKGKSIMTCIHVKRVSRSLT